jgi:hypothetical protein
MKIVQICFIWVFIGAALISCGTLTPGSQTNPPSTTPSHGPSEEDITTTMDELNNNTKTSKDLLEAVKKHSQEPGFSQDVPKLLTAADKQGKTLLETLADRSNEPESLETARLLLSGIREGQGEKIVDAIYDSVNKPFEKQGKLDPKAKDYVQSLEKIAKSVASNMLSMAQLLDQPELRNNPSFNKLVTLLRNLERKVRYCSKITIQIHDANELLNKLASLPPSQEVTEKISKTQKAKKEAEEDLDRLCSNQT